MATNEVIGSSNNIVLKSQEEALKAVDGLLEGIKSRAVVTDQDRGVARETVEEILDAGLFSVVTAKEFGGADLGFSTLVKVAIEIASACGSSGWVYGVLAGHSWLLNLFPIEAQKEILPNPRTLTATIFRLGGTITEVEGGYVLNGGEGRFCSGVDFADWVIVGNAVTFEDGRPPEPHFFVIPRSDFEIIDDWHTLGMRGTGSKSIKVAENTFIPAHRAVQLKDAIGGTSPGADYHDKPIYRLPFSDVVPFSIVGPPLGMAKGALNTHSDTTKARLKAADETELLENNYGLTQLSIAQCDLDAAIALIVADAERVDNVTASTVMTPEERAQIPRNWAYGVSKARGSANMIYEISGGANIYNSSVIQRYWRDINSAAQHFGFRFDTAMVNYGRTMVGHAPANYALKRKG